MQRSRGQCAARPVRGGAGNNETTRILVVSKIRGRRRLINNRFHVEFAEGRTARGPVRSARDLIGSRGELALYAPQWPRRNAAKKDSRRAWRAPRDPSAGREEIPRAARLHGILTNFFSAGLTRALLPRRFASPRAGRAIRTRSYGSGSRISRERPANLPRTIRNFNDTAFLRLPARSVRNRIREPPFRARVTGSRGHVCGGDEAETAARGHRRNSFLCVCNGVAWSSDRRRLSNA